MKDKIEEWLVWDNLKEGNLGKVELESKVIIDDESIVKVGLMVVGIILVLLIAKKLLS